VSGCPVGYRRLGDDCFEVCKPGFVLRGRRRCEKKLVQDSWCPKDYLHYKNRCIKHKVSNKRTNKCPKHYKMDSTGVCAKTLTVSSQCPDGHHSHPAHGCHRKETVPPVCTDEEYQLVGPNTCLREQVKPFMASCPDKYELLGDACVHHRTVNYTCPHGFDFHNETQKCTFVEERSFCGASHDRQGSSCVQIKKTTPICPGDFMPAGDACVHGVITSMRETRSRTVSRMVNGVLTNYSKSSEVSASCPEGFSEAHGQCVKEESVPAKCPEGYTMDKKSGYCIVHSGFTKGCPKGWKLVANACQRTLTHDPICPKGGHLHRGRCVMTEAVDAGAGTCPSGWTHFKDKCFIRAEEAAVCPGGFHRHGKTGRFCAKYVKAAAVCPPGFELATPTTCERKLGQKPLCPAGWSDDGTECVTQVVDAPRCMKGYFFKKHGVCERVVVYQARATCPHGLRRVGDSCHHVIIPRPCCARVYSPDAKLGCHGHDHKRAGNCVHQMPTHASMMSCPRSYRLNRAGASCTRTRIAHRYCPNKWREVGNNCLELVHRRKKSGCQLPLLPVEGYCARSHVISLKCPKGYRRYRRKCVRRRRAVRGCPTGSDRWNGPQCGCPPGYKLVGRICAQISAPLEDIDQAEEGPAWQVPDVLKTDEGV